jgi:hypothetical protein
MPIECLSQLSNSKFLTFFFKSKFLTNLFLFFFTLSKTLKLSLCNQTLMEPHTLFHSIHTFTWRVDRIRLSQSIRIPPWWFVNHNSSNPLNPCSLQLYISKLAFLSLKIIILKNITSLSQSKIEWNYLPLIYRSSRLNKTWLILIISS